MTSAAPARKTFTVQTNGWEMYCEGGGVGRGNELLPPRDVIDTLRKKPTNLRLQPRLRSKLPPQQQSEGGGGEVWRSIAGVSRGGRRWLAFPPTVGRRGRVRSWLSGINTPDGRPSVHYTGQKTKPLRRTKKHSPFATHFATKSTSR